MNMINDNNLLLPHHLRYASYTLNLLATTDFYNALKNSTVHSRIHYAYYLANALHCGMHHGENNSEIIHNALHCSLTYSYSCPTRWNSLYDAIQLLNTKQS